MLRVNKNFTKKKGKAIYFDKMYRKKIQSWKSGIRMRRRNSRRANMDGDAPAPVVALLARPVWSGENQLNNTGSRGIELLVKFTNPYPTANPGQTRSCQSVRRRAL